MKPIHVFATWRVKPVHLDAVLALLPKVAKASIAEEGNLFYLVHQHQADPSILVLYEGYRDEIALAAHRNSDHFRSIIVEQIVPLLEGRDVVLTNPLEL
jgi:quinol monooxygenase YgiN